MSCRAQLQPRRRLAGTVSTWGEPRGIRTPQHACCFLPSTFLSLGSPQTVANESANECTPCSPGKYQDQPRKTGCEPCPKGYWCTRDEKFPCPATTYNPLPNAFEPTSCERCPERTETVDRGNLTEPATSREDCVCSAGFYLAPDDHTDGDRCEQSCCRCPVGTTCDTASISLATLPLRRGYYRPSRNSVDVRRCPDVRMPDSNVYYPSFESALTLSCRRWVGLASHVPKSLACRPLPAAHRR